MTPLDTHLIAEAAREAAGRARERRCPVVARVILPLERPPDLREVLGTGWLPRRDPAFVWRPADGGGFFAACGSAREVRAAGPGRFAALARRAGAVARSAVCRSGVSPRLPLPLFTGGFSFADGGPRTGAWAGFPALRFWVPEVLWAVPERGPGVVAVATWAGPDESADAVRERLAGAAAGPPGGGPAPAPERYAVRARPSCERWRQMVGRALDTIGGERMAKVVLARTCIVEADAALDARRVAIALARRNPRCTLFWCRTGDATFTGATPELLVGVRGGEVRASAVAGTGARCSVPDAGENGTGELLSSGKDRREHAVVVAALREALEPVCGPLEIPGQPQVRAFEGLAHLVTPVRGRVRPRVTLPELAARLHPTPAVAGWPRRTALRWLADHEPVDRGWYAGGIGWMDDRLEGEFAVALRCCLIRDRRAWLFAGAGIVEGSDPDRELAETRLKLEPALQALLEV